MSLRPNQELSGSTIVITGGMGFLGSNLAHRLAKKNAVIVIDALTPDAGGNRSNLAGIEGDCSVLELDLSVPSTYEDTEFRSAVRDATHIFHFAARTSHPGSMADPLANLDSNGRATLLLLEFLRRSDCTARIVNPSTTSQTGPMLSAPITENHPEYPRDIYSAHKSLQEKYMQIYAHSYDFDAVSLRFSNIIGPRAAIHTPALGFANFFIGLGLTNADITVYGDGAQRRSLLYVDDAVDAAIAAASTPGIAGEVIQVANPEGVTVRQLADHIVDLVGGRVKSVPYPVNRSPTEIGDIAFTIEKARRCLRWSPQIPLSEAILRTAQYFRTRLRDYLVIA